LSFPIFPALRAPLSCKANLVFQVFQNLGIQPDVNHTGLSFSRVVLSFSIHVVLLVVWQGILAIYMCLFAALRCHLPWVFSDLVALRSAD
jgi:hypothetical protein